MMKKYRLISLLIASFVFVSLLVSGLPIQTQAAPTVCGDLFISEYIEGSSYNKAVEIYNGTGSSVDLSVYTFELYSNGAPTPSQSITLSGNLAEGDVVVLANSSASATILAQTDIQNSSVINFNGDDALVLRNNGSVIDVIGQVGFDPGTQWGFDFTSTADNTLQRQSTIGAGDTDSSDAFDPSVEWDGYAVDTFDGLGSHITIGCGGGDTAPSVSSTNPSNGATGVATDTEITINFSENVDLTASAVTLNCGSAVSFSGLPANDVSSVTLTPSSTLPESTTCNVNVVADQVSDNDAPEDDMAIDYGWSFTTAGPVPSIVINEIDADTAGTDALEFIELYDGGTGNTALDGLVVVFYNGSDDASYYALDLDGQQTDANGYFVAGNAGVTNAVLTFTGNTLQNGADAVALHQGDSADFPNDTAVTTSNLIDAVVYDTSDGDDAGLSVLLNARQPQVNENGNGSGDSESNQRCPNGEGGARNTSGYIQGSPSPGLENSACPGESAPTVSSTNPTNSASNVAVGANITINFSENVDVTGSWYNISCTSSGTHTAGESGGPQSFTLDPSTDFTDGETCTVTVYAAQVTDQDTDDPPDNMDANAVFSFTTGSGSSITFIHAIQGTGDTSPFAGTDVTIEGIVVGDFQDTVDGFYVQEEDADADTDPTTSEGIYVYSTTAVDVSDQVQVSGTVEEYNGETQISSVSSVTINSSGNTLPTAANPTLSVTAVSDWERYEGMRVSFSQTLFVTEIYQLGQYGQLTLADQRLYQPTHSVAPGAPAIAVAADNLLHTIILDDGATVSNPDPIRWPSPTGLSATNTVRGGDSVSSMEGVITYRYDFYRVYPTVDPTFNANNPRTAAPTANGTLRVTSFNVLNYFSTLDGSGSICGPLSNLACRGADTAEEFTRQRNKIINAIVAIDADVVGLIEIENHPTDAALQDLVNGLNNIAGAGTYAHIATGPVGTDAIKVALIYQPASVSPQGAYAVLDSSVDSTFLDTKNRPALAQTFEEIATGEEFTVIVNHLKSKGSDCDAIGDADTGDGQGNCNLTRTTAATALVNWLASDPTSSGDPDFLIMGDLNAYALEDPITAIKNAGYIDLINAHQGATGYSYVFDGQLGYLDYALSNPPLTGQVTNVTAWHINADEPISLDYNTEFKSDSQVASLYADGAYRASDHDPVVIDLFMPYGLADMSDLASGYEIAAHKAPHSIWLGTSVDDDVTFAAGSDDASDNGVEIISGTWTPGEEVTIRVEVSGGSGGWLSGWFDWNLDGVFADPGEKVVNDAVVAGDNPFNIIVPAGAQIGIGGTENDYLPVRFRLYESATEPMGMILSNTSPMAANDGTVVGGEVEDYVWGFTPNAITLQTFGGQTNQVDWMPVLLLIAGFSTLGLWGLRRYQKGKHTASISR